jgi:Cu(I)/Ag(I) efflux system membrane protein CusA/SilA
VAHVLGKAGRANTATDNSPISMIETIILLKPQNRMEKTKRKDIVNEINNKLQIQELRMVLQPIINRINMLSTGIRTDVGIKFTDKFRHHQCFGSKKKRALKVLQGKRFVCGTITGGKYIDIEAKRGYW